MKLEIISKYPSGNAHPTPPLFIHGTLHGAWCWDAHFLDHFAQDGYTAHAVNLRGHGNSEGRDNMLRPSEIEATARAYHTRPEIIPNVAHNSMLEPGWQNVAEKILMLLNQLQLSPPV